MIPLAIGVLVFVPMLIEAGVSLRNEKALRDAGAVEPPGDVYALMSVAYPAGFLLVIVEAWRRDVQADGLAAAGALVFLAAKLLKYWAITTLGTRWTFRVLVPPRSTRTIAGPYRFVRHPNYVAVIGEYLGAALMAHAAIAGPLAVIVFGALILRRIAVEDAALRSSG